MYKRLLVFSALSLYSIPLAAMAESVNVTSENIKSLLDSKSGRVTAARLEAKAAEERTGFLIRSFLPSIEATGGPESFKTGTHGQKSEAAYGVEAKLNIFNGGRDKLEEDARTLEVEKRGFGAERVAAEELEKARSTYWEIIYLQEKQSLLKNTLNVNAQNLEAAKKRIKSGVATDTDRFEFEMKEVNLKREFSQNEVGVVNQTRFLRILLGFPESAQLRFTDPLDHDHQYETVLKNNLNPSEFLFKESDIQADQFSLSAQSNQRAWWPKLDAFASYNKYNERIESAGPDSKMDMRKESAIGLKLSLSLPAGFESSREAAAQAKEAIAARAISDIQKRTNEADLQGKIAELKLLHDQVHEAEENILRAERYYKMTQSEYTRGVKNSPDVLGASEKLFDMRHKRLEIIRDFQVARAQVLARIGQ